MIKRLYKSVIPASRLHSTDRTLRVKVLAGRLPLSAGRASRIPLVRKASDRSALRLAKDHASILVPPPPTRANSFRRPTSGRSFAHRRPQRPTAAKVSGYGFRCFAGPGGPHRRASALPRHDAILVAILVPPPPARANLFRVRFARPTGFHFVIDRELPPTRADIRENLVIDCAISAL